MPTTYLTTGKYAAKHGVSRQRVLQWINAGRLNGAVQVATHTGPIWQIPATSKPPKALAAGRKKRSE